MAILVKRQLLNRVACISLISQIQKIITVL